MLEVHRAATQRNEGQEDEEREEAFFKRYLEFCRAKVSPRLSQPAADSLVSQYVELREQVLPPTSLFPLASPQYNCHMCLSWTITKNTS